MRRAWLLACAAGAMSCAGTSGTLDISLTEAPGGTVLANVETLRLVITDPREVTTATRGSDGSFDLALAFDAVEATGTIVVEGLDGSGALVAVGESPPFPLAAVTAAIVIYMAPPRSFGAAPLALDAARTGIAIATLPYGGVLAGGIDGAGAATDELHIYNAYDHSFAAGSNLPDARSQLAAATGTSGLVYLFGGFDGSGSASGSLWSFDTTQAPSGAYTDLGTQPQFARGGEQLLTDGIEHFAITGSPVLELDGGSGALTARTDLLDAPPPGASVVGSDGVQTVIFSSPGSGSGSGTGTAGCARLRDDAVDALAIAGCARSGHAMVALANGDVAIVGGTLGGAPSRDAATIDAVAGTATTVTGALSTARIGAAAAATPRYLVVAGGSDGSGNVLASADLLDATTLALVATIPMVVARTGAVALALPNEQVLVVGGVDGTGAPSDLIELFTPDAPPDAQ